MSSTQEKILLVEGDEDKRVIPELIEANGIIWGNSDTERIVTIKSCNGIENLLDKTTINTHLKGSKLKILGIMIDADENLDDHWRKLRNCLLEKFPAIPENLPDKGLVHSNGVIKVGIWIMPDNTNIGMLETFLQFLVPKNNEELWKLAEDSCNKATELKAPFKECHSDKAKIHTWLAWQDSPGRQLHQAVMERILDPKSPYAEAFIKWFKELYEV